MNTFTRIKYLFKILKDLIKSLFSDKRFYRNYYDYYEILENDDDRCISILYLLEAKLIKYKYRYKRLYVIDGDERVSELLDLLEKMIELCKNNKDNEEEYKKLSKTFFGKFERLHTKLN